MHNSSHTWIRQDSVMSFLRLHSDNIRAIAINKPNVFSKDCRRSETSGFFFFFGCGSSISLMISHVYYPCLLTKSSHWKRSTYSKQGQTHLFPLHVSPIMLPCVGQDDRSTSRHQCQCKCKKRGDKGQGILKILNEVVCIYKKLDSYSAKM